MGAAAHHALAQNSVIVGGKLDIVNINIILGKLRGLQLTAQVEHQIQTRAILHDDHFKSAGIALMPVALIAIVPRTVLLHCPVTVAVVPLSVGLALSDIKQAVCNGNAGGVQAVAEHIHSGIFRRQLSGKGQIHRHPGAGLQRDPHLECCTVSLICAGIGDIELIAAVILLDSVLNIAGSSKDFQSCAIFKIVEKLILLPYSIQGMILRLFHLGGGADRTLRSLGIIVPAHKAVVFLFRILRDRHHGVHIAHGDDRIFYTGNTVDGTALQVKGDRDLVADPLGIQNMAHAGSHHRFRGHFLAVTVRIQIPAAKGIALAHIIRDLRKLAVWLSLLNFYACGCGSGLFPVHIEDYLDLALSATAAAAEQS